MLDLNEVKMFIYDRGDIFMGKSISAFIITIIVAFVFTIVGEAINWPEMGTVFAIAIMGAFIIYFNDKQNKS